MYHNSEVTDNNDDLTAEQHPSLTNVWEEKMMMSGIIFYACINVLYLSNVSKMLNV